MAVSNPFFTKREPQTFNATRTVSPVSSVQPHSAVAAAAVAEAPAAPASSEKPAVSAVSSAQEQGGSKLTVGPNIKLKGVEITDCDTLVVEGTVEATMDSRVIHIAEQGAFHGSAEVDIAEIHGEFTGTLTVRQKLLIHSTGKVSGKVRYGTIAMEEGGQLSGEIVFGTQPWPKASASEKSKDAGKVASLNAAPVAVAAAG